VKKWGFSEVIALLQLSRQKKKEIRVNQSIKYLRQFTADNNLFTNRQAMASKYFDNS